jgi:hypothetical protein
MSLVDSISDFCFKNKRIICLIIFILLAIFLKKLSETMKEGLELNSCAAFNSNQQVEKTCANCLGVKLLRGDANSKCYWNSRQNKCGSFLDTGYSNTCSLTTDSSITDPSTTSSSSVPTLQLLDTPTWLADPTQKSDALPKLTLVDTPTWITK